MVVAELIRLLYRQVPAILTANLVNSSLVAIALWHGGDHRIVLGWAAAVWALTAVRGLLWRTYRTRLSTTAATAQAKGWGRTFTVGSTLSGLLWGSSALLLIRGDDPYSLLLIAFVIGGMAAGAVTGLSAHLPAFYLYLAASLLPLEMRLLAEAGPVRLAMAGMAAVFGLGLVIIGRNFNWALIRSLELSQEKSRLLANMDHQVYLRTKDLMAANASLEIEIGERKAAEAALKVAQADAERANQAKSRFLAAASHDLRQPLQSMFLYAHALHRHVSGTKGVDSLVRIQRGLDVLKSLLDSLLDLSRLDVNQTQPKISVFPLKPMLEDIAASYRRIAASKGLALDCEALGAVAVRSDPTLLGRMVRNLIENAIRYTDGGGIFLSTHVAGDAVAITVADTGIGIAPDQIERIFEEFHQVGNPERDKARGLGLGLAIVQRLSAILHHPVEVRSELGQGSSFSITVPLAEEVPVAAAEPCGFAPCSAGNGRRIVLIDDDPMVLLALGTVFEAWGYDVAMAGSEDEAVAQTPPASTPPHLIIADYRLRNGKVGTDAIKGVRARVGAAVPSILLTGETGTECASDAEALGAMVLHKPVTPNQLGFALKRLLGEDAAC